MSAWGRSLPRAIAELDANPRLRWGVALIIAILWFYGVLVLQDAVRERRQSYEGTLRRIASLQSVTNDPQWPSRLAAARALREELEARLWFENTVGLAQARFQDWLNQVASQSGLTRVALNVTIQDDAATDRAASPSSAARPGLWRANARLACDFNPAALERFLASLEAHDKTVSVEEWAIRSTPPRAEMSLTAYFLRGDPARQARGMPGNGGGR